MFQRFLDGIYLKSTTDKEFSLERMRKVYGCLSVFMLLVGIVIYLLFRDLGNMLLFTWIPLPKYLETAPMPLKPSVAANFLRFHLPDMLWFLSGIAFFRFIWFYHHKTQTAYIVCFYGVGLVLETSQLAENIPGTFDWLDLFFMGIGAFAEGFLYSFARRRFV